MLIKILGVYNQNFGVPIPRIIYNFLKIFYHQMFIRSLILGLIIHEINREILSKVL